MPLRFSLFRARRHRFVAVQRVTGILLMLFSLTMVSPVIVGLMFGEFTYAPFVTGFWITLLTGTLIWWPARNRVADLKIRDGFLVTVLF